MPKFLYEAKQTPTQIIKGAVIAESQKSAMEQVRRLGLYIVSVKEEKADSQPLSSAGLPFMKAVSLREVANFTRQLADLLESGFPVVKALDLLDRQAVHKNFKGVIQDIKIFCEGGGTLSGALERHPGIFSNLLVVMVKAGETGGTLDAVLQRLADFSEAELDIRTRIWMALAYPIFLTVIGAGVIFVILVFVVPMIVGVFADLGQALPLPTVILLWTSKVLSRYWWICLSLLALAGWGAARFYQTSDGRQQLDEWKLKLPLFGQLTKKIEIARFAHTLATLLDNGVAMLEALKVAADTVQNVLIKNELQAVFVSVKAGQSLSASLTASKTIPAVAIQMIGIGEESGHLEKTLLKVAKAYEKESDQAIKILMSLLEPALILVLGLTVGFIVIAILLPIFEISVLSR